MRLAMHSGRPISFLLIGPYDPHGGEYTFLAPPLGVWRLAGHLQANGIDAAVFDPNCCDTPVLPALAAVLHGRNWDVVGVSTTAMTLKYDLQLVHFTHRVAPDAILIAGGMEATFNPERAFALAPFALVVLGEGEKPLLELAARLRAGADLAGIPGTAARLKDGGTHRFLQNAMSARELHDAIVETPYERMPYRAYWQRLEDAYRVGALPVKADREARLAEIRSVRLNTLNYCPMGCSFCSSTNFLTEAQGSVARVARLNADECLEMVKRIVTAHPDTRTVIFQDDIFVFTQDKRVLPLCDGIVAAKASGSLPADLQFISTNRIDAMTPERLAAMRRAGFRVLGFGVENFSAGVLLEFNKGQIHRHIAPMLAEALRLGITPFLDLILTSPKCTLHDLAETVRQAFGWISKGCEVGMYPYVIPFTGAAIARDPTLEAYTQYETITVPGTAVSWRHAAKILPIDPVVREAILCVEARFNLALTRLHRHVAHLPSRVRSLLWIACAEATLRHTSEPMPTRAEILRALVARLPVADDTLAAWLHDTLATPIPPLPVAAFA
ncbi:MAG: B12-binding domain-containing radical SAM protein [Steroidobacteraceae bacterium]